MISISNTFTSESVCQGHPDKICDQISDAIVDEVLKQDPNGCVAVETMVTENRVVITGEVRSKAAVNYTAVARKQIKRLGYTKPIFRFTDSSPVSVYVHEQSPEIAVGVTKKGAGDQGMMFGYACLETKSLMPLPITIAHLLAELIDTARIDKTIAYLRPDGKTQVTVSYKGNTPTGIQTVVIAVPHDEKITEKQVKDDLFSVVVKPALARFGYTLSKKDLIVNGTGKWYIGGPASDTGLTGRKIVVDTYGGTSRVGGGAFSGKDPTKVDRSGAYAARYLAKNIVTHKLAKKAEVRLAYVIGQRQPLMQEIETFDTSHVSPKVLADFINRVLDTSVEGILQGLNLQKPIYLETASYGHFGRAQFSWEQTANV